MQALDKVAEVLKRYPELKLAVVFGSIACGRARAESDLDVAVAAQHPLSAHSRFALTADLAAVVARPVDLIDLQTAGVPLLREVLTTGTLLYCHDRELYAEILKRMVFEVSDMLPLRKRALKERRKRWLGT